MGKEAFTHSRTVKIESRVQVHASTGQVKEGGRMSSERAPVSAFTQAKNTCCSPSQQHNCSLRLNAARRWMLFQRRIFNS